MAVQYTASCCGNLQWTGVPATAQATATALAAQCGSSWPLCGCFDPAIRVDDHSIVGNTFSSTTISPVGVTCQAGKCTTYASICGHPCATATFCLNCSDAGTTTTVGVCAAMCP